MNAIAEEMTNLAGAVEEKILEFANVKSEIQSITNDVHHALASATAPLTKEQRIYGECFKQWLQAPSANDQLLRQCVGEFGRKDTSIASNLAGGFGLPKQLAATIDRFASTLCPWLDPAVLGAEVVNTSDYYVPLGLSDVSSSRVTESAARSATSTPAFRQVKPVWGEYYAYTTISTAARDDIPNLDEFLAREFAAQIGASLAADIVAGTGSNAQVLGLTTTTPVTTTDAASPQRAQSALQYVAWSGITSPQRLLLSDVENLLAQFAEGYLLDDSFSFVMRPSTLRSIWAAGRSGYAGVTDAAFVMPRNPTLYGFPVKLTSAAPAIAGNAFPVAAGAWKRAYSLVSRGPMMLTVDEFTVPGQVKYWARVRYGGTVRANNAAKLLRT
jgi:HK97 family phage major capsid protein